MGKLKKIKKKLILFFLLFIIGCFLVFRSKSYEIEYVVADINVKESYSKEDKIYKFILTKDNEQYIFWEDRSYILGNKFISDVLEENVDNLICLTPKSDKFSFNSLCSDNGELVFKDVIDNLEENESIDSYENININDLNNKTYFIWNYKGFVMINDKKKQVINLNESDVYTIPLTIKVGNYIVMADYNEIYEFSKFYVINSKNGKVREINLKEKLSSSGYFLGVYKDSVYYVDKKNKNEYEINPKKLKITKINSNNQGKIYQNGDLEKISMDILASSELSNESDNYVSYIIDNNILYAVIDNIKIKVSNKSIKYIVSGENDIVYYLVGDKLYSYQFKVGEKLLLSNFEWNFNFKNMIYVF